MAPENRRARKKSKTGSEKGAWLNLTISERGAFDRSPHLWKTPVLIILIVTKTRPIWVADKPGEARVTLVQGRKQEVRMRSE